MCGSIFILYVLIKYVCVIERKQFSRKQFCRERLMIPVSSIIISENTAMRRIRASDSALYFLRYGDAR